jgi:hypothetical protein
MTKWKDISIAPKDGSWIIVPNESVAMKWLNLEATDEFEGCSLWIWADETCCDIDPNPPQPRVFMLWPTFSDTIENE